MGTIWYLGKISMVFVQMEQASKKNKNYKNIEFSLLIIIDILFLAKLTFLISKCGGLVFNFLHSLAEVGNDVEKGGKLRICFEPHFWA